MATPESQGLYQFMSGYKNSDPDPNFIKQYWYFIPIVLILLYLIFN